MYKSKNQVVTQYKNALNQKDNRHSCAKLKTYHFSGEKGINENVNETENNKVVA